MFASNLSGDLHLSFITTVRNAWTADTTAFSGWSGTLPEKGQCAVTALLVQTMYGGFLNRAIVNGESHYQNTLPNGVEVDLTRSQFENPLTIEGVVTCERDYLLGNELTVQRYETLYENYKNQVY